MGVRGLTTYIAKHSDKYLEPHQLHDCFLVIDGNNLASQLYNHILNCNCSFGGDYDRYASGVTDFFILLKKCNISPLVLLDGGYEVRKLSTVRTRLHNKISNAGRASPMSFPLMMKEVFKDVLKEQAVPFAQCLFEADDEIAAVARQIGSPVLSYDSDFYVYDVLYIPFSTFCFEASKNEGSYYINCNVYRVETFLNSFGGLQKSLLPLMATLLGNDYIKKSVFSNFLSHIKRPKSRVMNETQRNIAGLLQWLRKETLETAILKIMGHIKKDQREYVGDQIRRTIAGYVQCSSNMLTLLHPNLCNKVFEKDTVESFSDDHSTVKGETKNDGKVVKIAEEEIQSQVEESVGSQDEEESDCSNGSSSENVVASASVQVSVEFPCWFLKSFQQGYLPSFFIDMLSLQTYFLSPQVDDISLPHSHSISLPIIQVIFGLLTASWKLQNLHLTYYARDCYKHLERFTLIPQFNTLTIIFPELDHLHDLPLPERGTLLFEALEFDQKDREVIEKFPTTWRLFVLALVYWARHADDPCINNCHIEAVLCNLVALNVVDRRAGYYRSKKVFKKEKGNVLKKLQSKETTSVEKKGRSVAEMNTNENLLDALTSVLLEDCVILVETLLPFHMIDEKLKSSFKLYSIKTVHSFAQFQSCLFHIGHLNALLGFPLEHCPIAQFYSGIFVYNAFMNLKKRSDTSVYIEHCVFHTPSVYLLYKLLHQSVMDLIPNIYSYNKIKKRRQRHKGISKNAICENNSVRSSEPEDTCFKDTNNKYFLLSLDTTLD